MFGFGIAMIVVGGIPLLLLAGVLFIFMYDYLTHKPHVSVPCCGV